MAVGAFVDRATGFAAAKTETDRNLVNLGLHEIYFLYVVQVMLLLTDDGSAAAAPVARSLNLLSYRLITVVW